MDLSISIISWNTRDILDQCLKSVYDTTRDMDFEIIVVDNASSDGSPEMVREKYSQVVLIENADNVGFSRANNQAYAASEGRHFLLLNPDTVVLNDALKNMVEFLDNHNRAGAVGPLVLNNDGSLQHSWARFPTLWSEALGRLDRSVQGLTHPPSSVDEVRTLDPFQADWVGGCCLMIKREAVEQIGLMDESLFMYCEETDWCLRLHKGGWDVWVEPGAEIIHLGGKSSEQASRESAMNLCRSKEMLFSKNYGRVQGMLIRYVLALKSGLRRTAHQNSPGGDWGLEEPGQLSVMELGCGKRREYAGSVTVDICEASHPDVVHNLNQYPYPFEDSSFDLVTCVHVLEHLDDVVRTVDEIHRVLKPGGILLVEVPHFSSVHAFSDPTHKHFFGVHSFDYFVEGTAVSQFDYSKARFNVMRCAFLAGGGVVSRLLTAWANRHPDIYEKHFAFLVPRHSLVYELEAVKSE